jgi:hypothetical protein
MRNYSIHSLDDYNKIKNSGRIGAYNEINF